MCTVVVIPFVYCHYFPNTLHLLQVSSEGTPFLCDSTDDMTLYIQCAHMAFKCNSVTNKHVWPFLSLHIFHKLFRTLDPAVSVDKFVSSVDFYLTGRGDLNAGFVLVAGVQCTVFTIELM